MIQRYAQFWFVRKRWSWWWMMIYCFCGRLTDKGVYPYFQPQPLSEILTNGYPWHVTSRIWTCSEPEFRICLMNLCSIENYPCALFFKNKIFIILHCINWPNFIVWLSLLLEILGNMFIAIYFSHVLRHKFYKCFIN